MSNGLLVPVGLSMLYRWYMSDTAGFKSKFVPATIAASHWPDLMAVMASCRQNNALEQAVSTATLGPVRGGNRCYGSTINFRRVKSREYR